MGFSSGTVDVAGPVSGAGMTDLQEESWSKGQGPVFAGGNRGSLADYYRKAGQVAPFGVQKDPYFSNWANDEKNRQLGDRQQLSDLYAQLNAQAHGAATPQQKQMLAQQGQAVQMQQNMANSAAGGAYAQSAARGALLQNRGVQGARDVQSQQQLKAADMMSATQQMQQVAQMQRAQDLQAQGLSMEDAFRQAEAESKARGMNINREIGYGGLELGSITNDYAMYQDALRRAAAERQMREQNAQRNQGQIMEWGGRIAGGAAGML